MMFIYLLMLVCAAHADVQQTSAALKEIGKMLSAVNLRLARIEDEQTQSQLMYNRHQYKLQCIERERNNMILWQQYTASLIKAQNVNDQSLEARQKTMMSQVNQLVGNTGRCCRDNMTVTCVNSGAVPQVAIQPVAQVAVIQDCGSVSDGEYRMRVGNELIPVYCEGGFITFQRRYNGQVSFDRSFAEYEQGFGAASSEHWMGLRYMHLMTKGKSCTFRARLAVENTPYNEEWCGAKYAADCDGKVKEIVAGDFRVGSAAEKYQINVVLNHTDFLHPTIQTGFKQFNGQQFTTKDQDNDKHSTENCAARNNFVVNGGFWYQSCVPGYPNTVAKSDTHFCTSSVCGKWCPYYFSSSVLQFRC